MARNDDNATEASALSSSPDPTSPVAGRSPQGAPQDHPVAVAGRLEITLATFEHRCLNEIASMQTLISPDNALIALLCDAVRVKRELVALYESGAPPAPGWQPIDTMPADGSYVLVVSPAHGLVIGAHVIGDVWHLVGVGTVTSGSERPTHWMELPSPPGAEAPAATRAPAASEEAQEAAGAAPSGPPGDKRSPERVT